MSVPFADRVRTIMRRSREEAARYGHDCLRTEHLLLAILEDGKGLAVEILALLGGDLGTLRRSVESFLARSQGTAGASEGVPFMSRAKEILDTAVQEAERMGSQQVEPEHLLLVLLKDQDDMLGQVLRQSGNHSNRVQGNADLRGGADKFMENKSEHRAFVLYFRLFAETNRKMIEQTNLEQLNGLLSDGWTIARVDPMSGTHPEGAFVNLLSLVKAPSVPNSSVAEGSPG